MTVGSGEEDRVERGGVGRDVRRVDRSRELLDERGAPVRGACTPAGRRRASSSREPVGEDRAEDGDADRAADLAASEEPDVATPSSR